MPGARNPGDLIVDPERLNRKDTGVTSFNEGEPDDPRISMAAMPGGTSDTTSVSRTHGALISTPSGVKTSSELGYFARAAFQYGNTFPFPNGDLTDTSCTRLRRRPRPVSTSRRRWPRTEVHAGKDTLGFRPGQRVAVGASQPEVAADHD